MAALAPFRFLAQSLRNSRQIGSVWPSSKMLSRAMVRPIFDENLVHRDTPLRVLEVGAGTGPVTEELVSRLLPGDTLDVVELNSEFCTVLRDRFGGGPVVPSVHEVSILDFNPAYRYDHVVSGLPFAVFPIDVVEQMYDKMFDLLEPEGTLIMFKYLLGREALSTFGIGEERRKARRLMELEANLDSHRVEHRIVSMNLPPAHVVVRKKPVS
jgi:phosphatidylethanolamine/phosphatidyl-N-methylethanolamine N-methyltransferase